MKAKRFFLTVAVILAILIPFTLPAFAVLLTPPVYDETFVGELVDKYERLGSIDEPKIVVIGGSSVAFGLDSAKLEALTGMPVVNFGLYATLGSCLMLEMSRDLIREGDIVVFAPETDPQAWSMYFSAEWTWKALDGHYSLLSKVGGDHASALWGRLWAHAAGKLSYLQRGKPSLTGIYRKASFNEYGDIAVARPGLDSTMRLKGYDPSTMITLDSSIVSSEFLSFLNTYIADAEAKGASVVLSFAPMNSFAVEKNQITEADGSKKPVNTPESIAAFAEYLREAVHCELISDPNDYIFSYKNFFDSNYHLNDTGVVLRTEQLAADLAPVLAAKGN